jgi:ATP-binding cassette subfamily B protein
MVALAPSAERRADDTGTTMMLSYLARVLPYLRPYWRLAVYSTVLTIAAATFGLLAPWPLKILVDNVIGQAPLPAAADILGPLVSHRFALLALTVFAGLAIAVISGGLSVLNSYINTKLEQRIIADFRADLFRHTERLSVAYRDQVSTGRLMYAINFEATAAGSLILSVQPLAQAGLTLVGMVWISLRIDPVLALLSITVVPLLYYAIRYYATHIQQRLLQVKGMEADCLSVVHDAVSMLPVITAFQREDHELHRFRTKTGKAIDARVDVTVRQTLFSLAVTTTTAIGTALVLGVGAYHAIQGRVTAGDLLVVLAYIAAVYKPLETISYTVGALQDNFVGLRMAFHILDTEPLVRETPQPVSIDRAVGAVQFENVHFEYPGRVGTLTDISLDVRPGQVVAIVGPTGAGKTTLMNLIPRFYDPHRGRVSIDGLDVRTMSLEALRRQISMVPQEPVLFAGTIADNIRYGRLQASMDEIVAAARAANAHDFIARLAEGYDTDIGERGVRLSGGERQRICVARAFLKDAPILILDEPTSSIDSKTEAIILDALDELMIGRTTFMIAHRLSTIRHADVIATLDCGLLVEQGTHDELLARGGLYKQMHDVQTRQRSRKLALAVAPELTPGGATREGKSIIPGPGEATA